MSQTRPEDVDRFRKELDESRRLQKEILAKISSTVSEKLVDASTSEAECSLPIEEEPDGMLNLTVILQYQGIQCWISFKSV